MNNIIEASNKYEVIIPPRVQTYIYNITLLNRVIEYKLIKYNKAKNINKCYIDI